MQKQKLTYQTLLDIKNMDILKINALDHQYVQNQIIQN